MTCEPNREKLLEVHDLHVTFGKHRHAFEAVRGVNFDIYKGETFGLVGESGSGKTTIGDPVIRMNPTSGGEILYKGEKINGRISREMDKKIIKEIQMIFQDPMSSLNDRAKVNYIVKEGLMNVRKHLTREQQDELVNRGADGRGPSAGVCVPLSARVFGRSAAAHRHCPCADYGAVLHYCG